MAIANLTLNSVVYAYQGVSNGNILSWTSAGTGIPSGFSKASMQLRPGFKAGQPWRLSSHLYLPVIATEDSECACAGTLLGSIVERKEVEVWSMSGTALRTDFSLRAKDLANDAQWRGMISNLVLPS